MTTKEFSRLFSMTTCEMSEFLGMSRQGLNEIVQGRSTKPSKKKRDAKHDLMDLAVEKRMHELQEIDEAYKARMQAIDNMFNVI
ncbi:MAG: hypothetical protein ACI4EY_12515 [Lachnospiraceae bacterium]